MKLYDIPKGSKIKDKRGWITFDHIDGIYSFCTVDWVESPDNVCHISAWADLTKEGDHYIINETK